MYFMHTLTHSLLRHGRDVCDGKPVGASQHLVEVFLECALQKLVLHHSDVAVDLVSCISWVLHVAVNAIHKWVRLNCDRRHPHRTRYTFFAFHRNGLRILKRLVLLPKTVSYLAPELQVR